VLKEDKEHKVLRVLTQVLKEHKELKEEQVLKEHKEPQQELKEL
jgi:hypothetical protein